MSNTIALAKKLEREYGFNQPQAEGIAQAIHEHQTEHLATKADLAALKTDVAQLQVRLMTWNAALAGIIIAVLKLT